jgi:hypothetical protein
MLWAAGYGTQRTAIQDILVYARNEWIANITLTRDSIYVVDIGVAGAIKSSDLMHIPFADPDLFEKIITRVTYLGAHNRHGRL